MSVWDKVVKYTYRANSVMNGLMFGLILLGGDRPKWLGSGQNQRLFDLTGAAMGSLSIISWLCSNNEYTNKIPIEIIALKSSVSIYALATFLCMGPMRKNRQNKNEQWKSPIFGVIASIIIIDTAIQAYSIMMPLSNIQRCNKTSLPFYCIS